MHVWGLLLIFYLFALVGGHLASIDEARIRHMLSAISGIFLVCWVFGMLGKEL